jgi:hypothetical protein
MSSSGRLYAFVSVGLLWIAVWATGQQPVSNKQPREIQMFTMQQDGSLTEINRETAAIDSEHSGLGVTATSQNTYYIGKLPGDRATVRYAEGQNIQIIALLPHSIDPRRLELQPFENRGKIRITYLRPFGPGSGSSSRNTRSFHAQQLTDGRWLLEPSRLGPGEYCFSPKFNNDEFCFGVDKK